MWTRRKIILASLFGGLGFTIQIGVAFTVTMIFSQGFGAFVLYFTWPLLAVLFRFIVKENNAITYVGTIVAMLTIPTASFGPPGFWPKIFPLIAGAMAMDLVLTLVLRLTKRSWLASMIAGTVLAIVAIPIFAELLIWFNVPGVTFFLEYRWIFVLVGIGLMSSGALLGERIYEGIRDNPSVKRLQQE